jgi:uncharacterized protein DUF5989
VSPSSRWAFAKNLLAFTTSGGRAWMIPILVLLLLVSVLALVGALTPYAAFLYPL